MREGAHDRHPAVARIEDGRGEKTNGRRGAGRGAGAVRQQAINKKHVLTAAPAKLQFIHV